MANTVLQGPVFTTKIFKSPEHNVVFIVCEQLYMLSGPSLTKLMAYDMDSRELRFIRDLEWGCRTPYLPYVPLLSEPFADGQ